jgi:hypothetical protein
MNCPKCNSQWTSSMVWPETKTPNTEICAESIIRPVLIRTYRHYDCLTCKHAWTDRVKNEDSILRF